MRKITLNGKRYIGLGDFDALRRNLVKDIYERYERDEAGCYHLSDFDQGQVSAYSHIMTAVMEEEIHAAESPEEIREMHQKLRHEWMRDKYVIAGKDEGKDVYYRKMCPVGEDGEEKPVFTGVKRLAKAFDDHYDVENYRLYLEHETGLKLTVRPLGFVMMTDEEASRLLHAIFDDEPEYHGDGTKAEDEEWDS